MWKGTIVCMRRAWDCEASYEMFLWWGNYRGSDRNSTVKWRVLRKKGVLIKGDEGKKQ